MRDKPSALPFRLWKFLQEELKMSHFSQFGSSISLILSSTSASTNIFLQRRLVCNVLCVSFTTTDHQIWDNGFVKRKPVILHQSPFTVTPIFSLGSVIMHGNNYLILLYVFLMSLHEDWSILIKFHKLSELSDLHGLCVNLESINQLFVNGKYSSFSTHQTSFNSTSPILYDGEPNFQVCSVQIKPWGRSGTIYDWYHWCLKLFCV